jgi:4-hydroxyphenylacetate 3-monooxygenase
MAVPTEADVAGSARADVERYLQAATLAGPERVRLFRLAWDLSVSGFAGRQNLYEYYFFGDPVRMAGALLAATDREPYKARVTAFLERAVGLT